MTGVPFLGSAGLLGSLVVKAFIAADTKVSAMDNTTSNVPYAFNVGFFISIVNNILAGLATRLTYVGFAS
jgi:UDP-glucose 4-epimerase